MATQNMPKPAHAAVFDECSSWIEQCLIRASKIIAVGRNRLARQAQLRHLSTLSPHLLSDIGLDDPEAQKQLFDAYLETDGEDLESLRNRLQVRC